jgi:hypothetical protein
MSSLLVVSDSDIVKAFITSCEGWEVFDPSQMYVPGLQLFLLPICCQVKSISTGDSLIIITSPRKLDSVVWESSDGKSGLSYEVTFTS